MFPVETLKTGIVTGNLRDMQVAQNCWICQGWAPVEFKLLKVQIDQLQARGEEAGPEDAVNVNLHCSFEDFKPHKMNLDMLEGEETYLLSRMVPPGKLSYFYTIGVNPP